MEKNKEANRSDNLSEAAQKLIERIRKADEVDTSEANASFLNVMQMVKETKLYRSYHRMYWWGASVAAIFIIALIGIWSEFDEAKFSKGLNVDLLDKMVAVSNEDVVLITDQDAMNLQDASSLKYDQKGNSNVQQYAMNKTDNLESEAKDEMHQIVVPNGKRADITFSDGTRIYINSGSKVIYPGVFNKKKREILVEGEVYLEVTPNKDVPFMVKTRDFEVEVLGTAFNLCAYRNEATASVVLVNGSVELKTENNRKLKMKPNQLADIKGGETLLHQVNVAEYISWKDNLLLLNQKQVGAVFKKLERYYGCKIKCSPEIALISLTGKLDLQADIIDVMDNLSLSLSLNYTINEAKEISVSLK